jgi:hypothetical protein
MLGKMRKNVVAFGISRFAAGATVIGALVSIGPAQAGTVTETATIPVAPTDWSTVAEVGQFDPSLGTLQDISFGLTGTVQGSIGVENIEPEASTVNAGISSTISLSAPGAGQILSVTPYVSAAANLAAFDGKINFAGPSGRTFAGLSDTQSVQKTYTVGASGPQIPTTPYIGTGKVALPVTASASAGVSGPLDLAARTQAAAGAAVTVKYGTSPAGSGGGGGTYAGSDVSFGYNSAEFYLSMLGEQHTAVQTRTLSDQNGDWTRNVTFNPFNQALGTLISADFTLSGNAKTALSLQDTGPTAGSYSVEQSALFNLLGPKGAALGSATAAATQSGSLAPFAGTDNFTKPFGTTISDTILSSLETFSDDAGADLAFFSGPDPLTLAVDAIGTLSAELPGSADLLSSALEGAQVTLSYTYLPSSDPPLSADLATAPVPEPAAAGGRRPGQPTKPRMPRANGWRRRARGGAS